MIHTRRTIFKTLLKRIRELTKHANLSPKEFKKILLAVILNDLKEWSEYIPKDDPFVIENMLDELLRDNCFIIERISDPSQATYVNVNTPQTNTTWQRVWDRESSETKKPELESCGCEWEPDSSCEIKLVYFYVPEGKTPKTYLEDTYGIYGLKLKTICDKMNIYIDRETGEPWYLDTDCTWKPVGDKQQTWTEQEILDAVKSNLTVYHNPATSIGILSEISDQLNPIEFCTNEEVEDLV